MTNEHILKQAIKKAQKSGYKLVGEIDNKSLSELYRGEYEDQGETFIGFIERAIIFDHDFAKAFFGEEIFYMRQHDYYESGNIPKTEMIKETINPGWQYHLSVMVLSENPVQYLEKFI